MIQAININQNIQPKTNVQMPTSKRNYCLFDKNRVDYFVSQKEAALPYLNQVLQTSNDEKQIMETLYILDRMLDNGTKGIKEMYPAFSRFNSTKSANIQTFLAGIYRKTQVPDAFGPLVSMLIQNSLQNKANTSLLTAHPAPFDPNEEIGGAILEYIRNYSLRAEAVKQNHTFACNAVNREQPSYSGSPKKIDISV